MQKLGPQECSSALLFVNVTSVKGSPIEIWSPKLCSLSIFRARLIEQNASKHCEGPVACTSSSSIIYRQLYSRKPHTPDRQYYIVRLHEVAVWPQSDRAPFLAFCRAAIKLVFELRDVGFTWLR